MTLKFTFSFTVIPVTFNTSLHLININFSSALIVIKRFKLLYPPFCTKQHLATQLGALLE